MAKIKTLAFWSFMAFMGGIGGYLGQAIKARAYPIDMVERVNLTPEVRPSDPLLLAQHVLRKQQCEVVVKRVVKTSSGQRMPIRQVFDDEFGPLGGDRYILPIPTDAAASLGPAEMYSKGYSWCGWLDYILGPSESEPWTLRFDFAENTLREATPQSFASIGVKSASTKPTPHLPNPSSP